ncbi:MAG: tetratricopeptide repeat protein [Ignavibacteria bacterium]|nr:tetratricopeptide repeat protein [Ignavibacteria bacterium]
MNNDKLTELVRDADVALENNNYFEAERLVHEYFEASTSDCELRIRAVSILRDVHWKRGRANDALPLAEEAIILANKSNKTEEIAEAIFSKGCIYNSLSDFSRALEYFNEALNMFTATKDKNKIAGNLS